MSALFKLFLIIPPGLEELALREVELKCPTSSVAMLKGGIELEGDLEWIEKAHTHLKIPTRILMRLESFKVKDFPKLHQKLIKLNWTQWLSHPDPGWEISSSQSRLIHTGRIEEVFNQALKEFIIKQPLSKDWQKKSHSPQTFYVRIHQDELTLSLDLTGAPLYKRGLQTIKGEAPLRENFAAAMVFEILSDLKASIILLDPMCGSGTFLTEALTFHRPLRLRKFSFEEAPFYKGRLLRIREDSAPFRIESAIGIDKNQELIEKVAKELNGSLPIEFKAEDSLKGKICEKRCIIICNPPYGERISIEGKRGSFLLSAWKKFLIEDQPLRFGWLLPSDMDDLFLQPDGYHIKTKRHLRNGGKAVTFWIWERSDFSIHGET